VAPTGRNFVKYDTGKLTSIEKFQIWLKSYKNIGHFAGKLSTFALTELRNISNSTIVQNKSIAALSLER
jgi:hypothetical protein